MIHKGFEIALAKALFHFSWQGCLIGLMVLAAARWLESSFQRYWLLVAGLACLAIAPVVNFWWNLPTTKPQQDVAVLGSLDELREQPEVEIQPTASIASGDLSEPSSAVAPEEDLFALTPALVEPAEPSTNSWSEYSIWKQVAPYASKIYLLGVATMLLRLLWSFVASRKLRQDAIAIADPTILDIFHRECERLRIRVTPALRACSEVAVPTVVGIATPAILIPAAMLTGIAPADLRMLLAHELVHIRRLDTWINGFQRFIEAALFFHPCVWLVSKQIHRERECCCDDTVVTDIEPLAYAQALVRMAELTSQGTKIDVLQLSADGRRPSELRERIQRLLEHDPSRLKSRFAYRNGLFPAGLLLLFLAAMLGSSAWLAQAQTDENPAETRSTEEGGAGQEDKRLGKLHGAVMDADYLLVPDASIEVYSLVPNIELVRKTKSNDDGWFEIEDLPRGRYTVKAIATYLKNGTEIAASSEPQRVDLTRGGDYLLAKLKGAVELDQPRHYMTSGKYAMHGTWRADFFTEKIAEQKQLTNFQLSGQKPRKDRRLHWGMHHQGVEAALKVSRTKVSAIFRNSTHRVLAFRIDEQGWGGLEFQQQINEKAIRVEGLAPQWPKLGGKLRPMYEIHLRPGDEFELQIGTLSREQLDDLKGSQIRISVPLLSLYPNNAQAINQHVGSGLITTGWAPVDGSDAPEPKRLFTFRGRVVDGKTGRPIPTFRTIPASVSEYHEKSSHGFNWQDHLLAEHRDGNLFWASRGYSRTRLRIEAEGYTPGFTKTHLRDDGDAFVDVFLYPSEPVGGKVVDSEGKPASGVTVVRTTQSDAVHIAAGKISPENAGRLTNTAQTDDAGEFSLQSEVEEGFIVAVHPELGYCQIDASEFEKGSTLKLLPFCNVEGKVVDSEGKPLADQIIWLGSNRSIGSGMPQISLHQTFKTNASGNFKFEKIAPGRIHFQRGMEVDGSEAANPIRSYSTPGSLVQIELQPGKTQELILGKPCAEVVGKLTSEHGHDFREHYVRLVPEFPPMRGLDMGAFNVRASFINSPAGRHYEMETMELGEKGEFRFPMVPAGRFQVRIFSKKDRRLVRHRSTTITVPYSSKMGRVEVGEVPILPPKN